MCFLDHINIVSTVSDGQSNFIVGVLDELDNLGFLLRCDSAAHYGFAVLGHLNELPSDLLIFHHDS